MIICFVCKNNISTNLKVFFRHLKTQHGINDINGRYSCCQGQCCRTFSHKYVFSRHLSIFHSEDVSEKNESFEKEHTSSGLCILPQVQISPEAEPDPPDSIEDDTNVFDLACKFVCTAKSRLSTLENVNSMVHACSEVVNTVVDQLFSSFKLLQSSPSESAWLKMEQKFDEFRDPFAGLKTSYQQTAFVERLGVYVPPEDYYIARSQAFVNDKRTKFCKPVLHKITGQYVPIKKMLLALHKHTDLVKMAVSMPQANEDRLTSYFDGVRWLEHPLHNQPVIVIRLYGDDFEPANPLGSHKCLYKMGCVYYQLENLPSHMQSKTENIFLALCYHSEDVKNFGWQKVFDPLVKELGELETNGIELEVNGVSCNYKVILSGVTGDNLFLNGLLGFVESFSASHPCRHCTDHKNDFHAIYVENRESLRTTEKYETALELGNVQETGIKANCCLNELKYFHASTNYVQDIMHDMLEGVCSYDVSLVCKQLIKDGIFSLSDLNSKVQSLHYGYHDSSSRPPVISTFDNDMLPFEASEMWAFVRYLPAAVGHLVPAENKYWLFYLRLRQILDVLFAHDILKSETELLSVLISEYLEIRASLFPDQKVKPKHHFMIHYPRLIQNMGPLYNLWSMRFEQKHQRYKRLMHISGNFKNVPKTVATRHQHDVASRLLLNQYSASTVETGDGEVVNLSQLQNGSLIDQVLGGTCLYIDFYKCSTVTVKGTQYKTGCCLLKSVDESGMVPEFVRLLEILVRNRETVIFFCEKLMVTEFDEHFHSWSVAQTRPRQYVHVDPKTLFYFIPHVINCVVVNGEEKNLICLRYRV